MTPTSSATTATTTPHDFIKGRHPPLFQGFSDESIDGAGHGLKGVLGCHEALNALVLVGLILQILKTGEILCLKLHSTAMTLLQGAAKIHDFAIQGNSLIISQKGFGRLSGGLDLGIGGDDGTKGFNLGGDGGSNGWGHDLYKLPMIVAMSNTSPGQVDQKFLEWQWQPWIAPCLMAEKHVDELQDLKSLWGGRDDLLK
ncbi:MAG: hypothetical protein CJBNEKGG_02464 [Prosthecobacter sp.]|nr:hypothetical protein [Prosthecobacter sp.]